MTKDNGRRQDDREGCWQDGKTALFGCYCVLDSGSSLCDFEEKKMRAKDLIKFLVMIWPLYLVMMLGYLITHVRL